MKITKSMPASTTKSSKANRSLVSDLLSWYEKNKRSLPWRKNRNPYSIWVSEMMLQQTQVKTVLPYYRAFLERFPDINALADASISDVLKNWQGLGYYSRARHMHAAANEVRAAYGGKFPEKAETLRLLPGIGDYTAAAVASMAFNEPVPVVDGNVWRVFSRILADKSPVETGKKKIYDFLKTIIPASDPSSFNQGMMELGSLICTPKNPKCEECPVNAYCRAFQKKEVEKFPVKLPKKIPPKKNWITLLFLQNGKILLKERPHRGIWGGLWEFPSIEVKGNISKKAAEFLSAFRFNKARLGKKLQPIRHSFSHFKVTIHPYPVKVNATKEANGYRWIDLMKNDHPLPKPYLILLNRLKKGIET